MHGTVHDENAAMLGGVNGHVSLFGTANDLAKLVQLYLWQGRYGGQQFLKAETVAEYTNCQFCPANRRGLGFDKPDPQNPALNAARSYGHTRPARAATFCTRAMWTSGYAYPRP